jgi:hypothetical protein
VCWELHDPNIRLEGEERGIALMQCFQPQLSLGSTNLHLPKYNTDEPQKFFGIHPPVELRQYWQGATTRMAGDFAGRCFDVLSKRPMRTDPGDMTIEVDLHDLDEHPSDSFLLDPIHRSIAIFVGKNQSQGGCYNTHGG